MGEGRRDEEVASSRKIPNWYKNQYTHLILLCLCTYGPGTDCIEASSTTSFHTGNSLKVDEGSCTASGMQGR